MNLDLFPFLEKPPDYSRLKKQAKTKRKKYQTSYSDEEEEEESAEYLREPRLIIYVAGGLSYEEIISI